MHLWFKYYSYTLQNTSDLFHMLTCGIIFNGYSLQTDYLYKKKTNTVDLPKSNLDSVMMHQGMQEPFLQSLSHQFQGPV